MMQRQNFARRDYQLDVVTLSEARNEIRNA